MATHKLVVTYPSISDAQEATALVNRIAIVDAGTYLHDAPPYLRATCAAYSTDGAKLIIGLQYLFAGDPPFAVYDADSLAQESGWTPPTNNGAKAIRCAPGRFAILLGDSASLRVYSLTTKSLETTLTLPSSVWDFDFSPDGSRLAVLYSSGSLRVYNTSTWAIVAGTPAVTQAEWCAYSPDGTKFAIVPWTNDGWSLLMYNTADWSAITTGITGPGQARGVSWRGDSGAVCISNGYAPWLHVVTVPAFNPLTVWSPPVGMEMPGGLSARAVMAPDGRVAIGVGGPSVATRRACVLAADLQTVEFDGDPIRAWPTCLAWAPQPSYTLSGTVETDAAAPAPGRRVLAMHDATERIVGAATTGADGSYSITTPHADGHTVVLIEDNTRAQASGSGIVPV